VVWRSGLFSDSAEATEARSAIAATERRGRRGGICLTPITVNPGDPLVKTNFTGLVCDNRRWSPVTVEHAAGERSCCVEAVAVTHCWRGQWMWRLRSCRRCRTAGVLFIPMNGDRDFWKALRLQSLRDSRRTDGVGFPYARTLEGKRAHVRRLKT